MVQVTQSAIKGEQFTGFEKRAGKGPFECGNCTYFKNGDACTQKIMKERSKEPRHRNGDVKVAAEDCCEYIERGQPESRIAKAFKKEKDNG